MFNPAKTKMLIYYNSEDETANVCIMFNGAKITISDNEKHLGTYIGKKSNSLNILKSKRECNAKVNHICSLLKNVPYNIK